MSGELQTNPIDRLFAALSHGDVAAARACLTVDARIWHSFDRMEQDPETASRAWSGFIAAFDRRDFVDVRRQTTADGFVQQHVMVARAGDRRMAWPICIVVTIRDGLIARLDEYMDRAGSFEPAEAISS